MNSPKYLNYEVRPFKFTERKMMLTSIQRICNFFGGSYQYIGLGGLAFTDFKLFHKELHINEMFSLEGGSFSAEKLNFNSPFCFIKIIKDNSTNALNSIDLTKKTLVWLDYDGALDNYMFDDITTLFSKLPIGSIYLMTCNKELKNNERNEYKEEEFREKFGNLAPYNLSNKDFSASKNQNTIRNMLINHIKKTLKDRSNAEQIELNFNQLFNIIYQEYRGANMYTFGGVISKEKALFEELNLHEFDFLRENEDIYKIEIPNLTRKEVELINSKIFLKEKELLAMNIVNPTDLEKFKKTYKYIPHFYDVRL